MILASLCFLIAAVCLLLLYCQAVLRRVTLRRHVADAFSAAAKGERPPRKSLLPPPVDRERIAELEREMGMEPKL